MKTGCIIGFATLVDCVTSSDSPWFQGAFGWILNSPGFLNESIPCNGKLGLWDYTHESLQKYFKDVLC